MPISRRKFLKGAIWLPAVSINSSSAISTAGEFFGSSKKLNRVRPGDPLWPSAKKWDELNKAVNGNLIKIESPFAACKVSSPGADCDSLFRNIKNPYYVGDSPVITQTSGWLDAWSSSPSVYTVAAKNTADVVAAVNFARENNLRLVVRGGGHSYQGTSNAPDSLMIWTRAMDNIQLHDDFVGQGCAGKQDPQKAVTVGAGSIWMRVYNAVTTQAGRYVQGGGCTTVGVAGLIQSGGFGSFSKNYGTAASSLLEAEVVTADGRARVANACTHPDLFWAIKGGGGGSFGVITRLTLKTHELPAFFGGVSGTIKAKSDEAYRRLISQVISFYNDNLFNPHWGEQIKFRGNNTVEISLVFQGLTRDETEKIWQPFREMINKASEDYQWASPLFMLPIPAQRIWDSSFMKKNFPFLIASDNRPNAPEGNTYWKGDGDQVGQFLYAYHSIWMPDSLLGKNNQQQLADAIFSATRHWGFSFHFNKGLAGAPPSAIAATKDTATNPALLHAFALLITAGEREAAFVGMPGHEPDLNEARGYRARIDSCAEELSKIVPEAAAYVSESDFFQKDWQHAFWGSNYEKLAKVKKKYDPDGLFFVHHGVGSEEWSDDGFTRIH
ncbi:MAG TPA: FAD-binding oxidoreductase [Puia sp.]|nr:FAD-binding oxidoreductase [Puia sp.]